MMSEKDEIAQRLYQLPYERLSAWGQSLVDRTMQGELPDKPIANCLLGGIGGGSPHGFGDPRLERLLLESARLENANHDLQAENEELWSENAELKAELAELQAKFNS